MSELRSKVLKRTKVLASRKIVLYHTEHDINNVSRGSGPANTKNDSSFLRQQGPVPTGSRSLSSGADCGQ